MGKDLKGKELGVGIRQKENGIYSARYINRFGDRKELYDKKLSELKRRLAAAVYDDKHGINTVSDKLTLSQWFSQWMEIHKYKVIRDSTKMHYTQIFKKHIEPKLGDKKLKNINQLTIKKLLMDMDQNGYGYATQNRVKIMLLDMFDKALIDDYVLKNPVRGIKLVRDEKKDMRVLTREEQTEFFDCCKGTYYDNLFIVAISTGMRQGEICALTWDDIDLDHKTISVNKTLLYQKLEGEEGKTFHINPPKTKCSKRTIPINKQCELALKKQYLQRNNIMARKYAKPMPGFENLLFVTNRGTPICDQILIDAIKKVVDEINLCRDPTDEFEMFSPHCFRHSFACRCFEAEPPVAPKTVQQFLGHASLQMTMDLYTHVLPSKQQDDMLKLQSVLDDVFDASDELAEDKYQNQLKKENKVIDIWNVV